MPTTSETSVISSYVKDHERLIITIVVALVLVFGYSKGINYFAARDQINSNKDNIVLQAQVDANKQSAAQSQQIVTQYQQLASQLVAANRQISTAQAQRAQATQQQQTVDKNLPPVELAQRWAVLTKTDSAGVQISGNGYQVSANTAVQTVVQLETIPQLQGDLVGEQSIAVNQSKQIDGLNGVVTSLHTQVEGLNTQIVDQTKACTDEIKTVKAEARKSKLKWYVAGLVTRGAIKLFAGI